MLCVPDPLTRASSLCWSQGVSGTDLLLSSLQRTGPGDMKQGWPCLCGLQEVSHLDSEPWACQGKAVVALPAAHPTLHRGLEQSMHLCCSMACVCVCVHTCGSVKCTHTQGGIRGGPLQPALQDPALSKK